MPATASTSSSVETVPQPPAERVAEANVLVIYHSKKGTQRAMATATAEGAELGGAHVRFRRISGPEDSEPADPASAPSLADLCWADGIVWATPTYYGNVSAPIKQFIDTTSALWAKGALADCVVTGVTSSTSLNGGQEATLLALYRSMYHWGCLVLSADSTAPGWHEAGANSYGLSVRASFGAISDAERKSAVHVGLNVARWAAQVHRLRDSRRGLDVRPLRPVRPRRVLIMLAGGDGPLRELAEAVASGAAEAGAEVRLRQASPEPGPTGRQVPVGAPDDVAWADAIAWGGRATNGTVPAAMAQFVESCQSALAAPHYAGKLVTAFGAAANSHAGGESMLLSIYTAMHHWGAVIAAPGYTDPAVFAAGGNPYGTLVHECNGPEPAEVLAAARHQGGRLAVLAEHLAQ